MVHDCPERGECLDFDQGRAARNCRKADESCCAFNARRERISKRPYVTSAKLRSLAALRNAGQGNWGRQLIDGA
jgi:hypothetical protein